MGRDRRHLLARGRAQGSFDQYAAGTKGKHGTADVDDAFLAEIERWRDLLAHNIALRNPASASAS